jgi:hypothetical protein
MYEKYGLICKSGMPRRTKPRKYKQRKAKVSKTTRRKRTKRYNGHLVSRIRKHSKAAYAKAIKHKKLIAGVAAAGIVGGVIIHKTGLPKTAAAVYRAMKRHRNPECVLKTPLTNSVKLLIQEENDKLGPSQTVDTLKNIKAVEELTKKHNVHDKWEALVRSVYAKYKKTKKDNPRISHILHNLIKANSVMIDIADTIVTE